MLATVASLLGYGLMAAGAVGLGLYHALLAGGACGLAQAAAVLLMIWARLAFGWRSFVPAAQPTAGNLVTRGPYRWIRHPIYTAVCLFLWAGAVGRWSPFAVLWAGIATVGALIRVFSEEPVLEARFPNYADYAERTWRMIPFLF